MAVRRGVVIVYLPDRAGRDHVLRRRRADLRARLARPPIQDNSTLVLRPGGGQLRETLPDDVVGQLLGRDSSTVRGFVESLRLAKRDARIRTVLLMPSTLESPFWGKVQELRDAIIDFRQVGQEGDRLSRVRRRSRVLPGDGRRSRLPDADQPARSHRRRVVRGLSARHARQGRRLPGLPAHRRLQDRGESAHREGLHAGASGDVRVAQPRHVRPARARHRRREEEDREARCGRSSTRARSRPRTRCTPALSTISSISIRWTIACRRCVRRRADARRIEGADYQRISPRSVGIRPRSKIAVLYAVGVIASGKSSFDPVNGGVVGSDTLVEQIQQVRDDDSDQGHRAARR